MAKREFFEYVIRVKIRPHLPEDLSEVEGGVADLDDVPLQVIVEKQFERVQDIIDCVVDDVETGVTLEVDYEARSQFDEVE